MSDDQKAKKQYRTALRGETILTSPRWNKGTAFTVQERKAFGLTGRLPFRVNTLEEQCDRAYDQFVSRDTPLRKNTFLQSLKEQNWVLYYALLLRHLQEMIPIIYTPTEAEAIANYSHLFRRSEGLYLTLPLQDSLEEDFLAETEGRQIDLIVVSDAEQILGIGDQGVGGIGVRIHAFLGVHSIVPVRLASTVNLTKRSLIGGVDPAKTLSVTLDVGTTNDELLNDRLYVGWRQPRVRGQEYDNFVDRFVQLVRKHHPHCLLHFEDFGVTNAERLLDKYRDSHAVFNDDVQGTGAVTLACIMSAVGVTNSKLADQRFVIFGAGSAGLGIARQLRDGIVAIDGVDRAAANERFYLLDKHGLLKQSLGPEFLREDVAEFVRPGAEWPETEGKEVGLLEVVRRVRPTVLIGCSTRAGAFSEDIVRAMAEGTPRPIILPLSNPSRLHEVVPQDAMDWTDGKALLATGSPFPPCRLPSGKEYIVAECNNALIYPGLGLGAMLSQARTLTDTMIIAGARRLASLAPALADPGAALLPDFGDAPEVNYEVAVAVVEQALAEGSAGPGCTWAREEVRNRVRERRWVPVYGEYVYDPEGET